MYFNDEKNNTSIDKELSNKTIVSSVKNNIKKIIIVAVSLIVLIILLLLIISLFKNKVDFRLLGDKNIKLTEGSEYIEPGYIAIDKNGVDLSDEVIIDNNVDTSTMGNYRVVYKLRHKTLQRKIEVIEMETGKLSIYLKGEKIIHIKQNGKYNDPGYLCIDSVDGDITNNIVVTNNVDVTKKGTYKVIYSVTNSTGITTIISRIVIVE